MFTCFVDELQGSIDLVLIDLEQDSVQDEARGLGHVQGLFSLGQPVDGVLQRSLETCGQGNGLFQLRLSNKVPS